MAVSLREPSSSAASVLPPVILPAVKRSSPPSPTPSPTLERNATALTAPAAELVSFPNPFRSVLPPAPFAPSSPSAPPTDPARRVNAVPKPPGLAQTERAPESFEIDLAAIERGDETRTTVMLKKCVADS